MANYNDERAEVVDQQAIDPNLESQAAPDQDEDSSQARNWRQARKTIEEQQRTIQLMMERERRYEASLRQPQPEPDEEIDPDGVVSARQVDKLAERKFRKLLAEWETSKGESVARAKFRDYDSIVTPENMERLGREDPDAVEAIATHPKKKGQAIAAYYAIKALEAQEPERANADRVRQNAAKPRPAVSMPTGNALTNASIYEGRMTAEKKAQAYREMQEAIKNR